MGGRKDHMEGEQGGDKPGEWNKDYQDETGQLPQPFGAHLVHSLNILEQGPEVSLSH